MQISSQWIIWSLYSSFIEVNVSFICIRQIPMNWYISDSMISIYSWMLVKMVCLMGFLYGQIAEMMKGKSLWNNTGFDTPVKIFLKSMKEKLQE